MKPIDADRDPAFDRFVARGLERETDASGNACPDADLLAAWFDRSLSPLEAERIEAHSAACGSCQQILADLARSEPEVTRAAPVPVPARPWHWHWRWLAPLATAVVVVVVGTRTLRAPAPLLLSAVPRQAKSAEPSAIVSELRDRPGLEQSSRSGVPAGSAGVQVVPGGAASTPRKESEMAKGMRPMSAPATVPGEERPTLRRENAAESVVTAVPRPPAAAPSGRPTALTRETTEPLLVTSAAAPPGNGVTWRYGQGGVIERSTDRGQTWERQRSGVTAALTDGSAPTDRICWIVGARGVVLRTTDGSMWMRVASPTMADLVSVHAWNDTNSTITAADHTEYVTTDGGASWRKR